MTLSETVVIEDFTVGGACSNCGACCGNYLPVSRPEIKQIRRYIRKNQIKEKKLHFPIAISYLDMSCPFRDETGARCVIYPVRPSVCRTFQCNRPKEEIFAEKKRYHRKYKQIDMRKEFFGGK